MRDVVPVKHFDDFGYLTKEGMRYHYESLKSVISTVIESGLTQQLEEEIRCHLRALFDGLATNAIVGLVLKCIENAVEAMEEINEGTGGEYSTDEDGLRRLYVECEEHKAVLASLKKYPCTP